MSQQAGAGLCSRRSVASGPGQRVVSFSFWGELGTKYGRGVAENLQLMARLYPGWVMRLYVSTARLDNSSLETLCDIQCNNTFGNLYVKIRGSGRNT